MGLDGTTSRPPQTTGARHLLFDEPFQAWRQTGSRDGNASEGGTGGGHALSLCVLLHPSHGLNSPVLGVVVLAACWGSTARLPSRASLVAGAEETEGLASGLGVAFAAWELAAVSPEGT